MKTKFDSAIAAIDKKLDKAKPALQEGKKLLAERQTLIKLADRPEWFLGHCFSVYVIDNLADTPDADDKRCIS